MLLTFDLMIRKILPILILVILLMIPYSDLLAQCSMCKAALETNMQTGGNSVGRGINKGIIYIMFVPYALMLVIGFFAYRHYKKTRTQ